MTSPEESSHWYTRNAPVNADQPKDKGLQPKEYDKNKLLIIDSTTDQRQTFLEIPTGAWACLELVPMADGKMRLCCIYPTGSTDQLMSSYLEKGHRYRIWHHTEAEGDYELYYILAKSKSNSILFKVLESLNEITMHPPGLPPRSLIGPDPAVFPVPAATSIGLSAGGAKDINNFRENIKAGYLPLPMDVTYEGLFYGYYFQTTMSQECRKILCPSYSYAISRDPFSKISQYYLSVGLNSGVADFSRRKLNLVVLLDYSGSMSNPFSQYYYDRFGNSAKIEEAKNADKTKMKIADQSIVDLLDHLRADDLFGLVIFSDDAFLVEPLTPMREKGLEKLTERILKIRESRGTNLQAGIQRGTELFQRYQRTGQSTYENRIILLTDAMPNLGEIGGGDLLRTLKDNAALGIYITIIGIGVDFNTELVDQLTKIRGANYYSVHSAGDFKKRMDDEFDFMVSPMVFDLRLTLDASGYQIEKIYGSPEALKATGDIMKVNTLFPTKVEARGIKGGAILIKLKKLSPKSSLTLKVSYHSRNGGLESDESDVDLQEKEPDFYQNMGIRKIILLSRYADLLKNWIIDERMTLKRGRQEWERQSVPLQVSEPHRNLFAAFCAYFQKEMEAIGDLNLEQELAVLEELSKHEESR